MIDVINSEKLLPSKDQREERGGTLSCHYLSSYTIGFHPKRILAIFLGAQRGPQRNNDPNKR